jgi:hypothetical protein
VDVELGICAFSSYETTLPSLKTDILLVRSDNTERKSEDKMPTDCENKMKRRGIKQSFGHVNNLVQFCRCSA